MPNCGLNWWAKSAAVVGKGTTSVVPLAAAGKCGFSR